MAKKNVPERHKYQENQQQMANIAKTFKMQTLTEKKNLKKKKTDLRVQAPSREPNFKLQTQQTSALCKLNSKQEQNETKY